MADVVHRFVAISQDHMKVPHPPPSKRRARTRKKRKTRCASDSNHLKGSGIENVGACRPTTAKDSRLRRGSLPWGPCSTGTIVPSSSDVPVVSKASSMNLSPKQKGLVEAWAVQSPPYTTATAARPGSSLSAVRVRLPSLDHAAAAAAADQIISTSSSATGKNGNDGAKSQPKKKLPLLASIKPYNQEAEREKFFQSNFTYNPQFAYRCPLDPDVLKKHCTPNTKYLDQAVHIMNTALKRYGTYENFERRTGGRLLSKAEIVDYAREYLKKERLGDKVFINLSEDLVSRGSMTRVKGRATLNVRLDGVREHWMEGLLRHEVGTHFMRSLNNRCQAWQSWKKRQEMELGPVNPTEEGLASLHSVLFRKDPCLWRSALLYYVAFKATFLSFVDLFQDLGRFVSDPYVKWDYCLRAKRGLKDTSQSGGFCKDQVYLSGALQILKHRQFIDFHALMKLGKIAYKDTDRLKEFGDLENTRVPAFMANIEKYRNNLEKIVEANGLDEYELEKV